MRVSSLTSELIHCRILTMIACTRCTSEPVRCWREERTQRSASSCSTSTDTTSTSRTSSDGAGWWVRVTTTSSEATSTSLAEGDPVLTVPFAPLTSLPTVTVPITGGTVTTWRSLALGPTSPVLRSSSRWSSGSLSTLAHTSCGPSATTAAIAWIRPGPKPAQLIAPQSDLGSLSWMPAREREREVCSFVEWESLLLIYALVCARCRDCSVSLLVLPDQIAKVLEYGIGLQGFNNPIVFVVFNNNGAICINVTMCGCSG